MKQLLSLLLLVSITAFMSCKGDQGDQGPAGLNGSNGLNGNANVQSWSTTIQSSDWVDFGDNAEADITCPILTSEIVNTGLVMVYNKFGTDTWRAWPYSYLEQSYGFVITTGLLTLRNTATGGASPVQPTSDVRVIAATSEGLARYPDLDWTSLVDVEKALMAAE